jgi:hypothetical protein
MRVFIKENCWHWVVFPFKAYIIAVPAAVLICQFAGRPVPMYKPDTYYIYLEGGYLVCLAVLIANAILAFLRNKKNFPYALMFIALTVVSMIVFLSYRFFSPPIVK